MLTTLGPAQIAALLLLAQRGAEEVYSQFNTRKLVARGAVEAGRDFYPVVAVTHLAWIAAIFLLIPVPAPISMPLLGVYLLLQIARYWVIGTLGPYWTHRIFTLPSAPIVRRGPYKWLRHPNYAVTIAETLLLPGVFGAWALGLIMTTVWIAVIRYKIGLEDAVLAERRDHA